MPSSSILGLGVLPLVWAAQAFGCVALDRDNVLAKDLVPANAWFAQFDPDLPVAVTPLAGIKRLLNFDELAALARRNRATPVPVPAPQICVERASDVITPERLQPVLEHALGGAPVKIVDYSRTPVPRGELEFTRAGLSSAGLWRGQVIYGQKHSALVWARIETTPAAVPSAPQPGNIGRGEQITVEVTSGAARLSFAATAESAGHAGDTVLVRNPANGRLFQAKVVGNGKVQINR